MIQDKIIKKTPTTQAEQFRDMQINCKTCQKSFIWTAKEQEHYKKRGFTKKPQRCSSCRKKANQLREQNMFYVHCALCKSDAVFITPPPKDRVALCKQCYRKLAQKYSKS